MQKKQIFSLNKSEQTYFANTINGAYAEKSVDTSSSIKNRSRDAELFF